MASPCALGRECFNWTFTGRAGVWLVSYGLYLAGDAL